MTDRSNDAFVIETAEHTLRCVAKSRGQMKVIITCLAVLAITVLGPVQVTFDSIRAFNRRGYLSSGEWNLVWLCGIPLVLTVVGFGLVLLRMRRMRGIVIEDGMVTLFTPDLPVARHRFERMNLEEAELFWNTKGTCDCRIHRRNGMTVPLFIGYHPHDLGTVIGEINALVIEDRRYGFEVIPVAQVAPKDQPPV